MEAAIKKEIGIDIIILTFTILLFWLLISTNILINNPLILVLLILAIPVWVSCLAITLALVSNLSAVLLSLGIPMVLVFFGITEPVYIAASVIMAALLASARLMFIHEIKSRVEYKTRYVFYGGAKLLLMAVIILITAISMPHITQSLMANEAVIPESAIKWLIKPYEPFIAKNIPGKSLSFDVSIDQIINNQSEQQYIGNGFEDPNLQKEIINQQLAQQLPGGLQQEKNAPENFSSMVTSIINNQIQSITNEFPFIAVITVFSIVIMVSRIIIPIISASLLICIAFLIWLSRKAHLIKLLSTSKPVEHLEL